MPITALRLVSVTEALGVEADQIDALLPPFAALRPSGWDRPWLAQVWRRRHNTLRKAWHKWRKQEALRHGRSDSVVRAEYSEVWSRTGLERYDPGHASPGNTPWLWRAQRLLADSTGAARWRQLLLIRAIEKLRPRSVLEVGCGNGINLMLLACRFPDIAFTGIELTQEGHQAAQAFQSAHAELPQYLRNFAPEPLADPAGFRRITFLQGSAAELPFAAGAFDLVITVLALEQMERIRAQALSEIARVTCGHTLMMEPFRDVNSGFWQRLNIGHRGYFQGCIADLADFGLEPLIACADFPQKYLLRAALVLSAKR